MERKLFSFEKLEAWKNAKLIAVKTLKLTLNFPDSQFSPIANQMRRSAISISSNIAEGQGRLEGKEQSQFYKFAYSSLMELLNQLIISRDFNLITEIEYDEIRLLIEKTSFQLNGLNRYTRSKIPSQIPKI